MKLIQSLQRAFNIINCFDEYNQKLTLNQISKMTELNINTTRGLVNTLVHNCYLEHDKENNIYMLGSIFIAKSLIVKKRENNIFLKDTDKFLECLADKYNVTARYHFVRNNNLVRIISKEPTNARYILIIRDSMILPLNATSSGKIILAYSEEEFLNSYLEDIPKEKLGSKTITEKEELLKELKFIRNYGYAKEFDEVGIGISAVAVPILQDNKLLGTISASGPTEILKHKYEEIVVDINSFLNENFRNLTKETII